MTKQPYSALPRDAQEALRTELMKEYEAFRARGLKLDMSRGKPAPAQLDLSAELLEIRDIRAADGTDCRNYGGVDGLPECKALFASILGVTPQEVIVGGNSSLNLMYDAITRAMLLGVTGGTAPWGKQEKLKFLCPVPGYDRHFAICEQLGIEMVNIALLPTGPDMDAVEALVKSDSSIKGIWCVPMYANPDGAVYADETIRRLAEMKVAADDFRIFWDNAYCLHHLVDQPRTQQNLLEACKAAGNPDRVYIFASTSKVTFAGAGVAAMAASKANIDYIRAQMSMQTIGADKINQLRHVRYLRDLDGVRAHMKRHQAIIAPKFDAVLDTFDAELDGLDVASWTKPEGGYFISLDVPDGCAKRVVSLCKEAGVTLTPAGATFPYGKDPRDRNIRIAPTFPSTDELNLATKLLCLSVRLAAVEKLLG